MRYLVVFILAASILSAVPAYSHRAVQRPETAYVEVVSEGGSTFLTIPYRDSCRGETCIVKKYLEARKGANYGIIIRNATPYRIGVVIAVDGRNIISGKRSNLKNNEEMYIVNGYEHARYDGWRTAGDTVHKFYFTETTDSYAVKTFEDSTSMGVIAVAVYREKELPRPMYESKRQNIAPAAPSSAGGMGAGKSEAAQKDESAGTGFGDQQYSPTIRVAFAPESNPVQKTLIKYEWRDVLCRKGLLQCGRDQRNRLWDEDNYAPYPPGYWGG